MTVTLPASMRVARLYGWGDVRTETAPVPEPGPGEALIRIEACGLCGSDALRWYVELKAPVVLGHEPAGLVVAVGTGVAAIAPGDRVFVHHHAPCDDCAECRRGLWSNCALWRSTRLEPGGFAQFALAPAAVVQRDTLVLPDAMDWETATFVEPVACCLRAVRRQGRLEAGQDICIVGTGSMGLVMCQLGRVFGARRVIALDFVADRRERALTLGAHAAIDPSARDAAAAVRDLTDGRGADVVIVCPGDAAAIRSAIPLAAPGGRVVCFTPLAPGAELPLADASAMYFREIALTHSYSCGPGETRQALSLLGDGGLEVKGLITHRAGLDGVGRALERAHGKEGIKTIIRPWS